MRFKNDDEFIEQMIQPLTVMVLALSEVENGKATLTEAELKAVAKAVAQMVQMASKRRDQLLAREYIAADQAASLSRRCKKAS